MLAKPIGLGRGRGGGVMGEPKLELPNLCGASHWHLEALPSDVSLSASRVQAAVAIADDGHLVRGEHESHRHDEVRQQGPDSTPPQPAFVLGRFWRSCGGIDSSCVTPAADCGVGVHCLAGSNSSISVISRVMGQGI